LLSILKAVFPLVLNDHFSRKYLQKPTESGIFIFIAIITFPYFPKHTYKEYPFFAVLSSKTGYAQGVSTNFWHNVQNLPKNTPGYTSVCTRTFDTVSFHVAKKLK